MPARAHGTAVRRLDGRCRGESPGGGKSGLHGNTVPVNGRRGRPQGKCHREQTACAWRHPQARVKRCGKSAPRCRQRRRHGKPHREQDRIGAAGGASAAARGVPPRCPGWSREARRKARPRGMVVPSAGFAVGGRTEPGLQAVWHVFLPNHSARAAKPAAPGFIPCLTTFHPQNCPQERSVNTCNRQAVCGRKRRQFTVHRQDR